MNSTRLIKQGLVALVLVLTLALVSAPGQASADEGDGAISGGSVAEGGNNDIWQQAAGATIITFADVPAVILAIGCGFCPASEYYDWWVAAPATALGLYLMFGGSAQAAGSGGSGFDGWQGGGGGGAGYSNDYSYGGGSW